MGSLTENYSKKQIAGLKRIHNYSQLIENPLNVSI